MASLPLPSRHSHGPSIHHQIMDTVSVRLLIKSHAYTDTHTEHSVQRLTGDVGGDLSERGLPKALGGPGTDGHQIGGSRMEAREHVVGLVSQLGHRTARTRHINARI